MDATETTERIPNVIGVRTDKHARNMKRWRRQNRHVAWSVLLHNALDVYFAKQQKEKAA